MTYYYLFYGISNFSVFTNVWYININLINIVSKILLLDNNPSGMIIGWISDYTFPRILVSVVSI